MMSRPLALTAGGFSTGITACHDPSTARGSGLDAVDLGYVGLWQVKREGAADSGRALQANLTPQQPG